MMKRKQKSIRGIFQPGIPLEELEKKEVTLLVSLPERRGIRYRCMRIRNKNDEMKDNLKNIIESQFDMDMNWDGFTEIWDISKEKPYVVVRLK